MKRGKILRDPRTGPGLLMIEGRQYSFSMEGVWKSEVPPKPGLAVDVKLDRAGQIGVWQRFDKKWAIWRSAPSVLLLVHLPTSLPFQQLRCSSSLAKVFNL
jgi:hypothetical protein